MSRKPPPRPIGFNAVLVRDVSEAVYRDRLSSDDLAKMLSKDGAEKVRERAGAYDPLTRAYMRALGVGTGEPE